MSRYEQHLTPSWQLEEDNALDKMITSENSLALHDADDLLDWAMNRYWAENSENGKWNFIRESNKMIYKKGVRKFSKK